LSIYHLLTILFFLPAVKHVQASEASHVVNVRSGSCLNARSVRNRSTVLRCLQSGTEVVDTGRFKNGRPIFSIPSLGLSEVLLAPRYLRQSSPTQSDLEISETSGLNGGSSDATFKVSVRQGSCLNARRVENSSRVMRCIPRDTEVLATGQTRNGRPIYSIPSLGISEALLADNYLRPTEASADSETSSDEDIILVDAASGQGSASRQEALILNDDEDLLADPESSTATLVGGAEELSDVQRNLASIQDSGRVNCTYSAENTAQCLVCNCLGEARGESKEGQIAVNRVVITRAAKTRWSSTICGAVFDPWQFSWANRLLRPNGAIRNGRGVAVRNPIREINFSGLTRREVSSCAESSQEAVSRGHWQWDHYYANRGPNRISAPGWARQYANGGSAQVGNHVFLQDANAGFRDLEPSAPTVPLAQTNTGVQ
jgi:hypothetical protein